MNKQRSEGVQKILVRVPGDVKQWLERECERNLTSFSSEVTLTLRARESITLSGQRLIGRFSTRVHYAGLHEVELLINGRSQGKRTFALRDVGATG